MRIICLFVFRLENIEWVWKGYCNKPVLFFFLHPNTPFNILLLCFEGT